MRTTMLRNNNNTNMTDKYNLLQIDVIQGRVTVCLILEGEVCSLNLAEQRVSGLEEVG